MHVFQPEADQFPRFDLLLLGAGEDSHTASLFPGHPLLQETDCWVAPVFDAPKPPSHRITLTLPVINNARHVVFVVSGAKKNAILSEILNPGCHRQKLPAALVNPSNGNLQWFLDATVYVLVAIVKKSLKLDQSLYTILQILSVTPLEKTLDKFNMLR